MDILKGLLDRNRRWAENAKKQDPSFSYRYTDMSPASALIIGCCDSRVPPSVVLDAAPGEMFVHRNVANLALQTDESFLAVLEYAVSVSGVRIVIVVGHHGCAAMQAAMHSRKTRHLDPWLREIEAIEQAHEKELDAITDQSERVARLCQLNVAQQVENLRRNPIIEAEWKQGADVRIYGLVYDPRTGLLEGEWIAKRPA